MRLFNRTVHVTVAKPEPTTDSTVLGAFFKFLPNAIEITDLRVQFAIEKSLGQAPNTCEVTITNLSEASRAFFQERPIALTLLAGYDGEQRRLYAGDVTWAHSERQGVDWATRALVGDGDRAYRHARVNRSFKAGVTARTAIKACAESMGLRLPETLQTSRELDQEFAAGLVLSGPSRDEITRLLAPYGYGWSIQDGILSILRDDDTRPGTALLISEATGMIGTPSFALPDRPLKSGKFGKGKSLAPKMTVRTLLYPQVTPGGLIQMDSAEIKGTFKVMRVQHTGDTHGDEWATEIEARSLYYTPSS